MGTERGVARARLLPVSCGVQWLAAVAILVMAILAAALATGSAEAGPSETVRITASLPQAKVVLVELSVLVRVGTGASPVKGVRVAAGNVVQLKGIEAVAAQALPKIKGRDSRITIYVVVARQTPASKAARALTLVVTTTRGEFDLWGFGVPKTYTGNCPAAAKKRLVGFQILSSSQKQRQAPSARWNALMKSLHC